MTTQTAQPAGNLSMESIAFQDKKFGKALEAVFEEIVATKHSGKELDEKFSPRIHDIIKEFTNLNMKVRFNATFQESLMIGPHVDISPLFLNNHVFLPNFFKGSEVLEQGQARARLAKIKENKLQNTVNTRRAWVTGIFAETEVNIVIPSGYVYLKELTVQEIVAVLIHEIGHAFTICEYSNRYNTTNQVLATMLRANKIDTLDVREYVFKEAGKILTDNEKMFDIDESIRSDQAVFTIMLDNVARDVYGSESGSDCYDHVSCEQAADQFASRMGYGRAIVTGLDKLFANPADKSPTTRHLNHFFETMVPLMRAASLMITMSVAGPAGIVVGGLIAIASIATTFLSAGERSRDHTYDTARVRYLRLREDLLQRIKDKKIPTEQVKEYLEDIKAIDKVVDSMIKSEYKSVYEMVSNFVFKKNKQALDARMLQRDLEELASNDLYRVAASLRTNK